MKGATKTSRAGGFVNRFLSNPFISSRNGSARPHPGGGIQRRAFRERMGKANLLVDSARLAYERCRPRRTDLIFRSWKGS